MDIHHSWEIINLGHLKPLSINGGITIPPLWAYVHGQSFVVYKKSIFSWLWMVMVMSDL